MSKHIAIIGAGLTGLACALHLAQRGYRISIFERRFFKQISGVKNHHRSLSMDLSARGIYALKNIDIFDDIKTKAVPMINKIYHHIDGELLSLPYGRNQSEHILTVARSHLFNTLFKACQKYKKIDIFFGLDCIDIDLNFNTLIIFNKNKNTHQTISPDIIIAADGIGSFIRNKFSQHTKTTFENTMLAQGYKELHIPSNKSEELEFEAMHLWPRNQFMLVAQPNIDHSFTCALILPKKDHSISFANIDNENAVLELFDNYFNDVKHLFPKLVKQYFLNQVGSLGSIKVTNWTANGKILLMGDAVHAMTPFFGQGVNCCFEDCTILMQCLDIEKDQWPSALALFNEIRVKQTNAISDMSYENYPELFKGSNLKQTMIKKQLEHILIKEFNDDYISYHNLVCFQRVPYDYAEQVKSLQNILLNNLSKNLPAISELNWNEVTKEFITYKKSLAKLKNSLL